MIYLDNAATSLRKPLQVVRAMTEAVGSYGNPGRGGHPAAMEASRVVYRTRELASKMFSCLPEQVVFTANCTHGLNIALATLVSPGMPVVISGFEHNAVTRTLHGLKARITVAGRRLFDWEDTLTQFDLALRRGVGAAVVTHVSNVFGYILPLTEIAGLCAARGVPLVVDAAQSAGTQLIDMKQLEAAFVAMPGHKGLLGPQGTGLLLCGQQPKPLLYGGTGSQSVLQQMPEELPECCEAGTLNVPGIAGLGAGLAFLLEAGVDSLEKAAAAQARACARGLQRLGYPVYTGAHQSGTLSFVPDCDCEEMAARLAEKGIAVRAGLHCAPLAHESAGTMTSGTVRVSYGMDAHPSQTNRLLREVARLS